MNIIYKPLIFLFLFLYFPTCFSQETSATHDSIVSWIEKAKDKKLSLEERKELNKKANIASDNILNDSLRNIYYFKINYNNFLINDTTAFKVSYKKSLILAIKLNDSITIANCYWDQGAIHKRNGVLDSAFFYYNKAYKILVKNNKKLLPTGKLLLYMATIQKDLKNYAGSEINTIKAINIFKSLKKYKKLYNCYNNLAIVNNNLKNYDKAIDYHKKALEYSKGIKNEAVKKPVTLNNIGIVYSNQNKHKLAIDNFKEALNTDSLIYKNPKQYAMTIGNIAYSKFKVGDYTELPDLFYKSLKIRDSVQHIDGIIINKIHLSEYYLTQKDTVKSYQFVKDANELAISKKAPAHLLQTYDLLAKVDPKNSSKHLRRYIEISDSTMLEERRMRDKFTRIEFETAEIEEKFSKAQLEAEQLGNEATKYKRRNKRVYRILWWLGGIIALTSIVLTIRYYQRQLRNKYEKVVLQQQLLRSQMNPHFLFNTLNTILHTTDTEPQKTKQYILKLSRLLRTTLENSREEFVPLEDEIEAIDNYLNLQSNFSEKFNFKVSIASDLETKFTYVPPMLIQPFVENAIIHGIMNTKTRGLISLNFTKDGDELITCTIIDNGIGYSKSIIEGKENAKEHNSISGDIVKERLAIYNKQTKSDATLKIEDIFDDQKNCIGTKVILNLPSYEI